MIDTPFDIASLRAAYAAGLTPAEVIETIFARIAKVGDPGIFIHLAPKDELLAQARELGAYDADEPLWGIPFAAKDNIDVAGMPTTAACPDYAFMPERDATVVALLKAAGAIVVGKTNMDQFATGLVGVRSPYQPPKNAVDPALVPGGSSSGSAVATAHGIVSFALGTDTAGSGRIPAGLNNIVGLKPTVGALSATGVVPACRTLDCVSIFALTVEDAYMVYSVVAKPDDADAYSRPGSTAAFGTRPPVLKIGVPAKADRQFFGDVVMEAAYEAALGNIEKLGGVLVEIPFADFYKVANLLYEGAWVAERYAAVKEFFDKHEASFHPVTRKIYGGAKSLSAADAFNGLYALQALKKKLAPVIASVDLFCVPTAPMHYSVAAVEVDPITLNSRLGTYTNFVNLLDMCGIAVPTGKRSDGLPASVTLLAPAGRDGLAASLASELHAASGGALGATGWPLPQTEAEQWKPVAGDIEIVVVGAHLSGMQLNGQLLALGATFDRVEKTTPEYRLFALPNEVVPKPGLLRTPDGDGVAVEIEVWRLNPEGFGRFVAAVPPPLGIGTITLADGTSAKGFLAEPAGLRGATDISHFGGWRAFAASVK
ncbi:MAG: Allophanate hydrolase [Hyphomicrobiales bacterium]|nr:Allophanate hydrolase [Hyphomicrobiales bacterium]